MSTINNNVDSWKQFEIPKNEKIDRECPVCLEHLDSSQKIVGHVTKTFSRESEAVKDASTHLFHKKCIEQVQVDGEGHIPCPIDRKPLALRESSHRNLLRDLSGIFIQCILIVMFSIMTRST